MYRHIFRRIFLSNYWWQESDIWSQASYRYAILWETFLDPSDSYCLFAGLVGFYTHWTYMHIFHHIFLSNYWWQRSDIWSQASYRYPISWETFLDPSDSYFLFADIVDFYTHWTYILYILSRWCYSIWPTNYQLVFSATFNNISVMSWPSILLMEETGVPGENYRPVASHWQTLSHNVVSSTPRLSGTQTHNISGDRHWLHR